MKGSYTAASVQRELRKQGDAQIAQHSQRFFKTNRGEYGEGDRFLGIRVPALRKLAKKFKHLPISDVEKLLTSRFHEERLLAILILIERYKRGREEEQEQIFKLCVNNTKYINNWDLVDICAPHIVGPYLFHKNKQLLFDLAKSGDLWQRRMAIMACYFFIRQHQFSTALKICRILLHDQEDLIHKAVGWMLREIGNRDNNAEEAFLVKHYQIMPRTMLRYAIEKFPADKRKRYLKGCV